MFNRKLLILLFLPILFISMIQVSFASELNFSVSAVIPDNQIDKNQSYFDLHMKPDQEQTLEVQMRNDTKKDVVIEVNINTAMTNNNGIIDYSQTEFERDPTLEVDLEDLVDYEKEVVVKAESSIVFPIKVNMPAGELPGMLLGGIHFQEKEDEQKEDNEKAQIENKFAYIIGLKMSMNDIEIKPNLELNKVQATQINYRNAVIANIQNSEPIIVSPLEIKAEIFKENGDKVLYKSENKDVRMAPNSNFDYAIKLENQEFKAGKYRVEIQAKNEEHEWEWEEYFTIEREEAKQLNEEAVEIEKDYTLWYIIGGVTLLLILLGFVYWLGTRKNVTKHKDE